MSEILVELHAGEGGTDSKLFIKDLRTAYCKYAEKNKLNWEIVTDEPGSTTILFSGDEVGSFFEHESGKHCVQRVPPTERGGRSHTSIISVAVLPILTHSDTTLNPNDLEIQATKGSGPGGQNKNKVSSAIRMRHIPTGFVVFIDGRDQLQNKKKALKILTARVGAFYKEKKEREYGDIRRNQLGGGGRSDKCRTYNFIKSRVVDHRLGTKTSQIQAVMKGDFGKILNVA